MEQREGDPGDLADHLGRGRCAEGERKGRGRPLTSGACGSASEPGRWQVGQGRSVGAGARQAGLLARGRKRPPRRLGRGRGLGCLGLGSGKREGG